MNHEEELLSKIRGIVGGLDLESCTLKTVVQRLQEGGAEADEQTVAIEPEQHTRIAEMVDQVLMERLLAEEDERLARELQQEELRRTRQRAARTKIPSKPKPLGGGTGKRVVASGFNRPMVLSTALSELLGGVQLLSRPAVVREIWAYVKDHQLQDPSNKKMIICDAKLEAIFKKKRIDCFQMNKYLSRHLHTQEEVLRQEDNSSSSSSSSSSSNDNDDDAAIDDDESPNLLPAKRPNINQHSAHSKHPIPERLWPLLSESPSSGSKEATMKEIQDGCLGYVRHHQLFDPSNPTSIKVDDRIREALALEDDTVSELTLFDFVEKIRTAMTPPDHH